MRGMLHCPNPANSRGSMSSKAIKEIYNKNHEKKYPAPPMFFASTAANNAADYFSICCGAGDHKTYTI